SVPRTRRTAARPSAVIAVAAAVLVLTPAVSGLAAPARGSGPPPAATTAGTTAASPAVAALLAHARTQLATTADTGASNLVNLGGAGWRVASSASAGQSGAMISAPGYDAG